MKRLTFMFFVFFPVFTFSQIKLAKQAEPQLEEICFDYSSNWQGEKYRNYIGQTLYVVPGCGSPKLGYLDFYETPNGKTYKPIRKHYTFSSYESLANKTFKVEDACVVGEDELGRPNIYLKLTSDIDTLYYKYDSRYEGTFPFIVMGYFEKAKEDNIGKQICLLKGPDSKMVDYVTGKDVLLTPVSTWTCSDIVLDTEFYRLTMLFTNAKEETISCDLVNQFRFITETYRKKIVTKYGKVLVQTAINGYIQKGMPADLVKVAYGEPSKVNNSSSGEQWVYDNTYVYIKNGKVTGWN